MSWLTRWMRPTRAAEPATTTSMSPHSPTIALTIVDEAASPRMVRAVLRPGFNVTITRDGRSPIQLREAGHSYQLTPYAAATLEAAGAVKVVPFGGGGDDA